MGGPGSGWRGMRKITIEECRVISLANFADICAPGPGEYRFTMRWEYPDQAKADLCLTTASDGGGSLWLSYFTNGEQFQETITIVSNGGRRWFICPVKALNAKKLFLPPGAKRFASRTAYDLTYRSCQESGRPARRARWRARLLSRYRAGR